MMSNKKLKSFFQNLVSVTKKVTLPTKKEVQEQLLIVAVGLIVLLFIIILGDLFGELIISKILEMKGVN